MTRTRANEAPLSARRLRLTLPPAGLRQMRLEPGSQLCVGHRTHPPVDLLAVPDQDEQRDALNVETGGDVGCLVGVELDDLDSARVVATDPLDDGRDHAAGSTPRRPEVDEHRNRRPDLLVEAVAVGFDDPREQRMADAAARDAGRAWADAVLAAAVGADDDRALGRHQRSSREV